MAWCGDKGAYSGQAAKNEKGPCLEGGTTVLKSVFDAEE